MIPKFTSDSDRHSFVKALPKNANYRNMLKTDFGFIVPKEAPDYQVEGFYKFLLHENRNPTGADEIAKFMTALYDNHQTKVVSKPRKEKYVPENKNGGFKPGMTGEPSIKQVDDMWYGYLGENMVVRSRSKKYVLNTFEKKGYTL